MYAQVAICVVVLLAAAPNHAICAPQSSQCIQVDSAQYGKNCGSSDSVSVRYRNVCGHRVKTLIELDFGNGKTRVLHASLNGNESSSYYVCHGIAIRVRGSDDSTLRCSTVEGRTKCSEAPEAAPKRPPIRTPNMDAARRG